MAFASPSPLGSGPVLNLIDRIRERRQGPQGPASPVGPAPAWTPPAPPAAAWPQQPQQSWPSQPQPAWPQQPQQNWPGQQPAWPQQPAYPGQQPAWPGQQPAWPGQQPAAPRGLPMGPGVPIPAMPGPFGIDLHLLGSKVFGFLLKAYAKVLSLLGALGLRKPNQQQAYEAWQRTEQVFACYDPQRTGYLYGQALEAWMGGPAEVQRQLPSADRNRDGMLDRAEVQRGFEKRIMADAPLVDAQIALPAWLRGGADVHARLSLGPKLAPGQAPSIKATVDIGPDVLREVEAQAYAQACQAIATRQPPDMEVPAIAKQALARFGQANANGQASGAIVINLDHPGLVEAVRSGVTRAVIDTPLRRFRLRPEGMVRLRTALINSGIAQRVIVSTVDKQATAVQRQVETLSNGVVVFHDVPVGRTGARVVYQADGWIADVDGTLHDARRWLLG